MEFLIGLFSLIGSFLAGFFGHVVAHDFCEFTPKMCRRLIEHAASLLPEADRARYTEEWLAHLDECLGVIQKFRHAGTCVLGARRLGSVRSVLKPYFRTLRIGFEEIGFVELDFATSMVLMSFLTSTAHSMAKQGPLRPRVLALLRPRARSKLAVWWLVKNLASACIRHRRLGPINPSQITPFFHILSKAIRTKNSNLRVYRDGVQLDLSHQLTELRKTLGEIRL
jgi:hypothetical protein